jgi:hypothetical protein
MLIKWCQDFAILSLNDASQVTIAYVGAASVFASGFVAARANQVELVAAGSYDTVRNSLSDSMNKLVVVYQVIIAAIQANVCTNLTYLSVVRCFTNYA